MLGGFWPTMAEKIGQDWESFPPRIWARMLKVFAITTCDLQARHIWAAWNNLTSDIPWNTSTSWLMTHDGSLQWRNFCETGTWKVPRRRKQRLSIPSSQSKTSPQYGQTPSNFNFRYPSSWGSVTVVSHKIQGHHHLHHPTNRVQNSSDSWWDNCFRHRSIGKSPWQSRVWCLEQTWETMQNNITNKGFLRFCKKPYAS